MAKDGHVFFRVQFLVGAGRDIAHGHKRTVLDAGSSVLPRLPDVNEAGLLFAEEHGCFGWGNLKFEHEPSLVGRACRLKQPWEISLEEMPPILNAQTITKQFGAKPLFKDISFTAEDRARIGLMGPNGAGKSTLLAILAGAVEPDTGELAVRKRARAAYVPQDSRFTAELTVRQVLETALRAANVNEGEREGRLRELSGRAGFDELVAEAASLSGGWRKRVAIAG